MILSPTPENVRHAAAALQRGDLVAFPTETVYGLGADARNDAALQKIFSVKGRPRNNPLIVHVARVEQLDAVIDPDRSANLRDTIKALASLWPGPLSLILPKHPSISPLCTAGLASVAVRIPSHPVALDLLRACDIPVAAPSANRFMYVSPTTARHVEEGLGNAVSVILDGGQCSVGIESTVLSLVDVVPTIVRPGAVTIADITAVLGREPSVRTTFVDHTTTETACISPGNLARHYSPTTPVHFIDEVDSANLPALYAIIRFSRSATQRQELRPVHEIVLSERGDLEEVACGLFAALRDLDQLGLGAILVERCEERDIGIAIMDRLRRATTLIKPTS